MVPVPSFCPDVKAGAAGAVSAAADAAGAVGATGAAAGAVDATGALRLRWQTRQRQLPPKQNVSRAPVIARERYKLQDDARKEMVQGDRCASLARWVRA